MGKVKFGLSNAHYAIKTTAEDGTISYSTPKPLPGSVSLNLDPQGELKPFYADNIVYYSSSTNGGYSGDFVIADITKDFQKDILGYIEDDNGAMIEDSNAVIKEFALMYEIKTDIKPRKAVLYNCKVTRPSSEAQTEEESVTPITDKLTLTATAREDNKFVKAILEESETNKTVFDTFYNEVYEPEITPGA